MARDKNTYAKRQRESLKRQKAQAKQARRRKRKEGLNVADTPSMANDVGKPSERSAAESVYANRMQPPEE